MPGTSENLKSLQDLLGGELQRRLFVDAVLDRDRVLLLEVTGRFLPDAEFVGADGQVGDLKVPVFVRHSGVGMIEDDPVGDHPGVDIARDLGRQLFGQRQWLDGDTLTIFRRNNEVVLTILDRVSVGVVSRLIVRENEDGLVGANEQHVRQELAALLVEGDLWGGALLQRRMDLRRLLGQINNDVLDPFGFRVDDELFVGDFLSRADGSVLDLSVTFGDQWLDLGNLAIQNNLTFERSPLCVGRLAEACTDERERGASGGQRNQLLHPNALSEKSGEAILPAGRGSYLIKRASQRIIVERPLGTRSRAVFFHDREIGAGCPLLASQK